MFLPEDLLLRSCFIKRSGKLQLQMRFLHCTHFVRYGRNDTLTLRIIHCAKRSAS